MLFLLVLYYILLQKHNRNMFPKRKEKERKKEVSVCYWILPLLLFVVKAVGSLREANIVNIILVIFV